MTYKQIQKKFNAGNLAQYISIKLKNNNNLDNIEFLKCKLGMEVILINFSKFIIVYGLAFLSGNLYITALSHISYTFIRINAYGIHSKKNSTCTIVSIILFVFIPNIFKNVVFSVYIIALIIIFSYWSIYKYAPANTSKNKISNLNLKKKLKYRAVIIYTFCIMMYLCTNSNIIRNQIIVGTVIAVISILPITYKIFKEGEMKDGKYIKSY